MVNAAPGWASQGDGHVEGADRQVFLHPVADGPADHPTGMQVQDDGQINPALARPDIGYVASPFLVGLARSEILLQEIRRDVECVVTVGSCFEFMGSDHTNRILSHQTPYPAVPDAQAQLIQLFSHSGATVAALACSVLIADMRKKHHVTPLPV